MTEITQRLSTAVADRYRLERHLGEGGMATVYLAEDLKHKRKVALKVLRPELAAILGGERFLNEIRVTANLQHPNILPLYDSGEADTFLYYVMPHVEGESLRQKMDREKQLGVEETLELARAVAGALQYAHEQGIVHRDIKPENILLQRGQPLVADFGIALAVSHAGGTRLTETGLSLGTPHYMSPEQATGDRELDARSDVYSLGAMVYEMLTGEPPHHGTTVQAIIARILSSEPEPISRHRPSVPPHVDAAVRKALDKTPADRFPSAAKFAEALTNPGFTVPRTAATHAGISAQAPRATWSTRVRDPLVLGSSFVAVAAIAATVALATRPAAAPPLPPIRFVISATDSTKPVDNFPWPAAIAPDGSTVVYTVAQDAANWMLYALRTDQLVARPIPGTTNGYQPYFSPDGSWLAFESGGKERKVRLDGSAPVTITDAAGANGADWTVEDVIVLGAQGRFRGLSRVSAAGGEAVAVTEPDTTADERNHLWPIALPDGRTIVFTIWSGSLAAARLAITSLDDGRVTPLGISGIRPLAVLDGKLVYVQADGAVMAVPVDARRRRIDGDPIPVLDPVQVWGANNGNSGIFISRGGALVASRGGASGRLEWIRRDGRTEQIVPEPRAMSFPRVSPDGRRIAVVVAQDGKSDVWIYDLALATFSRLTSAGTVTSVEWTADGSRVVFSATGDEARGTVWQQLASGGSPAEQLFANPFLTPVATMSPDGRSLLVNSLREGWDVFRVPLDSERVARPYLTTDALESSPRFSPDGRWVAIQSDESGQSEVYVRSFPDPASRIQISVAGGSEPTWSPDGSRLFYRSGTALLSALVSLTPSFTLLGRDTVLAEATFLSFPFSPNYDVTRDGRGVLAILPDRDDYELVVSPNWITEFRQRVAESGGAR